MVLWRADDSPSERHDRGLSAAAWARAALRAGAGGGRSARGGRPSTTQARADSREETPMTLEEIQEGMPVLYIPQHAQEKRTHPDCQRGMVTGKTAPHVLVRYGTDRHSNTTAPAFLVPDAPGALGLGGFLPPPDRSGGARGNAEREE